MSGKSHAHRHVADSVFQNQIPADDPGDEFAHGRVGIGIGATCNRNHGSQFGVAESCERTHNCHQDERKRQPRPGARPPEGGSVVYQIVEQGSIQNGGGIEFLAGDGSADYGKDSGANYCTNAESSKRDRPESPLELTVRLLAIRDQLVDGLTGKELVAQKSAPSGQNEFHTAKSAQAYHAQTIPARLRDNPAP